MARVMIWSTCRGVLPLIKTKSNMVAITSYYGKLFMSRSDSSVSNYSKWILSQLIKRNGGVISNLVYGTAKIKHHIVPRRYSAVADVITSFNLNRTINGESISYFFYFNFNKLTEVFTEAELTAARNREVIPCGRNSNGGLLLMDALGIIYDGSARLGPLPYLIDDSLGNGAVEYTEFNLLNRRIPTGLALSYIYGFENLLHKLKIHFQIVPTGTRIPFDSENLVLKFKDVIYILTIKEKEHELLLGGFTALKGDLSRFKASDFNKQNIYGSLLTSLSITTFHLRELALIWDMFMEPITVSLLKEINGPTDIYGVILAANRLLINDYIPDYNSVRYKGYERLCGIMYQELINAVRAHRSKGIMSDVGVTMKPSAVWLSIVQDQTIAIVEESNPIHNLKEQEAYTHSGSGGRSTITMVASTRGFDAKDLGVVSEASPDSSKVGVRAFLTPNANIINIRGMVKEFEYGKDGVSSVISSTALLSPGITKDDSKRTSFVNVQHSHGVQAAGYEALPYRTGYEEIIASRTGSLFSTKAKDDGIVTKLTNNSISVKYKNEIEQTIELGIIHGVVAGEVIPHSKVTKFKVGDIFHKGDILVYNEGFFAKGELNPNNVVYKAGVLSKIALIDNSDTVDDGVTITTGLAKKLVTPETSLYGLVVDFNMNVYNLVKVGDTLVPDSILCTIEQNLDDNIDRDSEAIMALSQLSNNNPKCKVYGKVTRIEVLYFGKIENMSPSLQELVTTFDKLRAKRVKQFGYEEAKTGQLDESIRVAGKKVVKNQVAIKIYVDGALDMGDGDKLVVGNQLKCTVSRVDTNPITAEDGTEIDGVFGYLSIAARIVGPELAGICNTVLIEMTKQMRQQYKTLTKGAQSGQ